MGALPLLSAGGHCGYFSERADAASESALASDAHQLQRNSCALQHLKVTLKGHLPVGQSSSEVALDVGVHDGFEMLEFAVLEEVDDVDLETSRKHHLNTDNNAESHESRFEACALWVISTQTGKPCTDE